MRLVEQTTVANWIQGRLELFLDGSWGQVCSARTTFTGSDADVACRQLGFSGGAVAPNQPADSFRELLRFSPRGPAPPDPPSVVPEVALSGGPGCTGSEQRLLDCVGGDVSALPDDYAEACLLGSDYESADDPTGLFISCVAEQESGAMPQLHRSRLDCRSERAE